MFAKNFIQALKEDKAEVTLSWTRAGTYLLATKVRGVELTIDKDTPLFFNYPVWIDNVSIEDIPQKECGDISRAMNKLYTQQCFDRQNDIVNKANNKLLKKF